MRFRSTIPHKAGSSLLINGSQYQIDADGVIEVQDHEDAAKLKQDATWLPLAAPKIREPKQASPREPIVAEAEEVEAIEAPADAEPEPEWPEPHEGMELSFLRSMSDAYKVKYGPRSLKATLVRNIKKAMYEE